MGKRLLAIAMIAVLAILFSVPMVVSAEEAVTTVTEDAESVDILYRVKEFIICHGDKITYIAGILGAIATVLAYIRKMKNSITTIVSGDSSEVKKSQGNVVDAMNIMIAEYNEMRKQNEEMYNLLQKFFATASAVELESKTLLEIMECVHVNNKNLPQGVKDLITQLYAQCKITENGLSRQVADIQYQMTVGSATEEGSDVA